MSADERGPATAYAESLAGRGAEFSWSELEHRQFARHPRAQALLAESDALRSSPPDHLVFGLGAVLLGVAPVIVAGIVLLSPRDEPAFLWWSVIGIALAVAYAVTRVVEVRGRRWRPVPQEVLLAQISAGFGALAAGFSVLLAVRLASPVAWLLGAACTAMLAASVAVVVAARRRAAAERASGRPTPVGAIEELRELIDDLDDDERARLTEDLRGALEVLVDSHIVDRPSADAAVAAPLGGVARRLWAEELRARWSGSRARGRVRDDADARGRRRGA